MILKDFLNSLKVKNTEYLTETNIYYCDNGIVVLKTVKKIPFRMALNIIGEKTICSFHEVLHTITHGKDNPNKYQLVIDFVDNASRIITNFKTADDRTNFIENVKKESINYII